MVNKKKVKTKKLNQKIPKEAKVLSTTKAKTVKTKKEKDPLKKIKIEPVNVFDQFYKPLPFIKLLTARKYLILDIDIEKISYLVVKKSGSEVQVSKCGIQNLASNEVDRINSLKIALTNLRSRFFKSGMKVIASFSSADINIRQITLPKTKKKSDLDKVIHFKNENEVPNFNKDTICRYQVIKEFDDEGVIKILALVTTVPGEIVRNFLNALDKAGLKPEKLIPRPLSITATYSKMVPETECDLIAVISSDFTEICYSDFGRFMFFRKAALGSSDIQKAMKDGSVTNSEVQAKKLNKSTNGNNGDDISSKIRAKLFQKIKDTHSDENPVIKMFLSEINRSIEFLSVRFKQKVKRLFLSGGGAQINELVHYLQEQLDISVVLLQPQFSISESNPNRYSEYFTVLGTALHSDKKVDFIPSPYKKVQILKSLNILLIVVCAIVAVGMYHLKSLNKEDIQHNNELLTQVQNQYQRLNPVENRYNETVLDVSKIQQEKRGLQNFVRETPQVLEIMRLISNKIPSEIILNSAQFGNYRTTKYTSKRGRETPPEFTYQLTLIGQIKSEYLMGDVILINFINELTDLKYFNKIQLKNKNKELDKGIFEFELILLI